MGREIAIASAPQIPVFGFNDIEKIATAIARGGLFGSKDPYAVLTLCMLAQAEGQHPAVVFRDYDLIQGKPAKKAEAMLRDFVSSGGKVTWNRLDDECADATFSHPQGGEVTINWTMARAQKAQLGGKDMWKKYPRQMLRSRTVSEGVRTVYPGATSGLYVPEEVRDFDSGTGNPDTPPTPQAKRARDLKAEAPKEIEANAADQGRAKAETWADEFIGKLGKADAEGAKALFEKSAKAIAKLEHEHPDLHEKVMEHAPAEDEGGGNDPDPQTNDLAPTLANIANAAVSDRELAAIEKDTEADRAFMSPEQVEQLDEAFATKRAALREAETAGAK